MVKTNTENIDDAFEIGSKLEKLINNELEGIVEMKIEGVFKTILILAKKRYAGLEVEKLKNSYHERIVMKGIETVRRDWCDLTGETLSKILEIILIEQNPKKALNYMKEVTTKLQKNEIPIEKLIVTKSVSKSLKEYRGIQPHIELVKKMRKRDIATAPGVGDRVGFVIVQGLQIMSYRAEDPEYIKQHNLKIDSKYYVENQIIPPVERVFEAMGISRSELVGMGKQLGLMDAIKNGNKKPQKNILNSIDGFICDRCNSTFRRSPLVGRCGSCSGDILFYSGEQKSRFLAVWVST